MKKRKQKKTGFLSSETAMPPGWAPLRVDMGCGKDVKRFIYENARVPFNILKELGDSKRALNWTPLVPKWLANSPDNYMMCAIPKADDDILVTVEGGFGIHSAWSPGGLGIAVTKVIDKWR